MSECKNLLEEISKDFNCKVWVCRKIGKRISFINDLKAGIERFEQPKILYQDSEFIVFAQVQEIHKELIDLAKKVVDCVRYSSKDTERPTECQP